MSLPIYNSESKEMSLMQTAWASSINPVLQNPLNSSQVLKSISLVSGANTINHLLGRKLQGWFIVRQRASATLYDQQDSNTMQDKTLVLVSSGAVVVDIAVF